MEQAADGVVITDRDGRVQYVNPAFTAMTGYTRAEVVGQTTRLLKSGRQSAEFYGELWSTILSGGVWHGELINRRKDGTFYSEEMQISPVRDPSGAITGYIAIKQDVTEQRAAQDAQAFLASIVEGSEDAIMATTLEGAIRAWNRGAEAIFGYSPQEAIGQPVSMLMAPEGMADLTYFIGQLLRGITVSQYEGLCSRKDGSRFPISVTGSPVKDAAGAVVAMSAVLRDVSDRRKSEQKLRESEERFRGVFENAPVGMYMAGLDTRLIQVNEAFCRMLGYSAKELLDKSWQEFCHPDDAAAALERRKRLRSGEVETACGESRYIHRDGSIVWTQVKVALLQAGDGSVLCSVVHVEDITERRHAELALKNSEEKFRQLAENIREVFWMMNAAGTEILYVGPAYEEIWGRSCESLYAHAMDWMEAIHPDDRARAHEIFMRQLQGESIDSEYRIMTPGGQEKWIRDRAFPVRDKSGDLIRIAGIAEEFTDRKRAERALQASEEKFRQLTENIREVFWVKDAVSDQFVYVSPAYERVWGRSCESLYRDSRSWLELVHAEDIDATYKTLARQNNGEAVESDFRIRTADGREKWIRNRAFPIHDQSTKLIRIVGVAEEITERKKYEAELILAREGAEAANLAKSRFLANMSHEIRTPMSGVIGANQLLLETDLTAEQRHYVEVAQTSGRTLLALIDDILDLSKIEAGKIALDNREFSLNQTVNEVVQLLRVSARAKGLTIVARISPQIPELLRGDAHRLQQVLRNLVANAVKFTDRGEIALNAELDRHGDRAASVRFTVTDTGIGIREDKIPALFAPFVQADASTTRRYGGSGLGLAISKQLVEMMGGSIGVNSREGQGSTFWFTATFGQVDLDRSQSAPRSAASQQHKTIYSAVNPALRGHGERILIAEDNPTNRALILAQIRKLGYEAAAAANGIEAVEAVERGNFSLVLMDCHMPLMDGYEATRRIRQSIHPHIPIVALTASALSPARERCLSEGMDDYLAKPVELPHLAAVLAKWISKSGEGFTTPAVPELSGVQAAAIFNADSVLRRLMGDRELARVVLKGFLVDAPCQLKQLCAWLDESDAPRTRLQAHTLKGSAATVGADSLYAVALAIETDASESRLDRCPDLLVRATDEFERFKRAVEKDEWVLEATGNAGIGEKNDV